MKSVNWQKPELTDGGRAGFLLLIMTSAAAGTDMIEYKRYEYSAFLMTSYTLLTPETFQKLQIYFFKCLATT